MPLDEAEWLKHMFPACLVAGVGGGVYTLPCASQPPLEGPHLATHAAIGPEPVPMDPQATPKRLGIGNRTTIGSEMASEIQQPKKPNGCLLQVGVRVCGCVGAGLGMGAGGCRWMQVWVWVCRHTNVGGQ